MAKKYDAIVVGGRCAGSPTAMLLARKGYRVLMVDRATFPSDHMSSHFIHSPGVAALKRWGLLEAVEATGCPPVDRYILDFGPFKLDASPLPPSPWGRESQVLPAYSVRRTILDKILVDAAADAGVEVREGFFVEDLVIEDGRVKGIIGRSSEGSSVIEHAEMIIGADGHHSRVAEAVAAPRYEETPPLAATYYAYWEGLPLEGLEVFIRPSRSWGANPTNDGLTCIALSWPMSEFTANRRDIEGNFMKTLEMAPEFAERVSRARRVSRFVGTGDMDNYFRKPWGPGWALVGDAGYHKDPCTAQGITDAFRDSELLAEAVDEAFSGRRSYKEALGAYEATRNEVAGPMLGFTCQLASLEPPPPEMQQLLGAVHGNQEATNRFVSVIAGTVPVPEFFSEENVGKIMSTAELSGASR